MDLTSRIAVCISGQVRTGVANAASILKYLSEMLPACDIFIHTWNVNSRSVVDFGDISEEEKQVIRNTFSLVDTTEFEQLAEIYKPLDMRVDNFKIYQDAHFRRTLLKTRGLVIQIPMFQSIYEVNQLKKQHEELCFSKYMFVVRLRFDLDFGPGRSLLQDLNYIGRKKDMLYFVDFMNKYPDAIEDVCWIANSDNMDIACDFALVRESIPNSTEWQTHMKEYLNERGVKYRPFENNRINIIRQQ
jgi:hypothetical protein